MLHALYITKDSNISDSLTVAANYFYKNAQICIKYEVRRIPGRNTTNKGKRKENVVASVDNITQSGRKTATYILVYFTGSRKINMIQTIRSYWLKYRII
jgi:hypothetical protein